MSTPHGIAPPSLPPLHVLWPLVLLGIAAVSCASILIRSAEAPSLAIAAYRLSLASVLLGPFYARKALRERDVWSGNLLLGCILSGFFLALHFIFWIESIGLTSISSSATLVSTTPIFAALVSHFFLGERMAKGIGWGLALTVCGSALVAGADFTLNPRALRGDFLALLGAAAAAGYLLSGRFVRRKLPLSTYVFIVYSLASLVLLAGCLFTGTPLSGFSRSTYAAMVLLALVPQLIGHTLFNWTLKFLSPTSVAVLILGEPIGATFLAYVIFEETVPMPRALGLLVLGAGILICSWKSVPQKAPQ